MSVLTLVNNTVAHARYLHKVHAAKQYAGGIDSVEVDIKYNALTIFDQR